MRTLYTQAVHGPAEADALLSKLRMDRDYLNDETHLVPNEVWHAALVAVVSRWGRGALEEVVPWVVAPENLGVWTHVLRGATSPRRRLPASIVSVESCASGSAG